MGGLRFRDRPFKFCRSGVMHLSMLSPRVGGGGGGGGRAGRPRGI